MKNILVVVAVVLLLAACTGPAGETGPEGAVGGYVLVFQDGLNGYAGTTDAYINEGWPTNNYGGDNS